MTSTHERLPESLGIDAEAILGTFAGPAVLLTADGTVVAANGAGSAAAKAIARREDEPVLTAILASAREGAARSATLLVHGNQGEEAVDFFLLPLGSSVAATHVMALGKGAELEQSLVGALVASRQMYKDLVECSSDFAWETKADRTLSYVSARGALGYAAADLIGKDVAELLANDDPDALVPFSSSDEAEDVEVWMRDVEGKPACLIVSSRPVHDESGRWVGNRGVCKDVTAEKKREHDLDIADLRQQLLGEVVDAMRNEAEPQHMLGAAARAAAHVLGARYCWIVRARRDGTFTGAIQFAGPEGPPPRPIVEAVRLQLNDEDEELFVKTEDSTLHVLVNVARYRDRINGAICVARDDDAYWDETDRGLLGGVANHLGIAFAQIENGELLEELSRTDELDADVQPPRLQ